MPQIEVTFDIDANGIVNVSAKDLGTGKEQHITITSSTNMSKDDIEKAVKEAEQFAAEDAKRKDEVDTRNQADQMVYQSEKALSEMKDKLDASEVSELEGEINKVKEALKGTDIQAIKTATEGLTQAFYKVSEKMYQQTGAQGGQPAPTWAARPLAAQPAAPMPVKVPTMWWMPTTPWWTTSNSEQSNPSSGGQDFLSPCLCEMPRAGNRPPVSL